MFDIATRLQPAASVNDAARLAAVPFDWRLTVPEAARAYGWTDFTDPSGVPHAYAEPLATYALALEDTLQTCIILSLFSDARASADDELPGGVTDRRGWVGDEFVADQSGDAWGSLLWLHYYGKSGPDTLERARFAAQEALAWMVRDGLADRIVVTAEWVQGTHGERLAVRPQIYRPAQPGPVYDVLWGTSIARGAEA